jgi:glycosyltransferase involved in cell wall biosynthesis
MDKSFTRNLLKNVLREIGHDGTPAIYLLHGDMSRKDMNNLYRDESIKAFISLTRGEGFGLPHLESAVAGLPVVATNWSAHKEFLDLGKWISVDYKLEAIHQNRIDNEIFVNGAKWAFPDEKDFKRKIRKLSKSFKVPRQWASDLSTTLKEKYSWTAISKKYEESIGDLLE